MKAKTLNQGKPIVCAKCDLAGGTLVKIDDVDDEYICQDKSKCALLQARRRLIGKEKTKGKKTPKTKGG